MCFDLIDFWIAVIVLTVLLFGLVCLALPDDPQAEDDIEQETDAW